jgi:hypothetical protein
MKHDVEVKRDGFDNLIFKPKAPAANSALNSGRNGSAMNSARTGLNSARTADSGKSSPNFLRRRSGMAGGMSPMTPDAPMNTLLRVPNLSRAMSASPPSARSGISGMSSGNSNWNSPNSNNFGLNRNLSNSPKIGFNLGSPNINSTPKIGHGNGNGTGNGNSCQYALQPQNTTYGSPKRVDVPNPDAVNLLGISPHLAKVQTGGGVQPHLHLTALETTGGGLGKAKRGLDSPIQKESPNDDPSQRKVPNSPNSPGKYIFRKCLQNADSE